MSHLVAIQNSQTKNWQKTHSSPVSAFLLFHDRRRKPLPCVVKARRPWWIEDRDRDIGRRCRSLGQVQSIWLRAAVPSDEAASITARTSSNRRRVERGIVHASCLALL
jgi:hypothetical protein